MAGAGIKIEVKDSALRGKLALLAHQDQTLQTAVLKNIGEALLKSTRKRFAREVSPDGKPWQQLNPQYKAGKKGNKILQGAGMRGGLLGTIVYQVNGSRMELGTNKIYAAIHQFGGVIMPKNANALVFRMGGKLIFAKKVTIPARPYLGISAADRDTIGEIILDHINGQWEQP